MLNEKVKNYIFSIQNSYPHQIVNRLPIWMRKMNWKLPFRRLENISTRTKKVSKENPLSHIFVNKLDDYDVSSTHTQQQSRSLSAIKSTFNPSLQQPKYEIGKENMAKFPNEFFIISRAREIFHVQFDPLPWPSNFSLSSSFEFRSRSPHSVASWPCQISTTATTSERASHDQ